MKTKNILLVDDEIRSNKTLLKSLREKYQLNVIQTTTSKETIDYLIKNKNGINCILLDIMIPIDSSFNENEKLKSEDGFSTGFVLIDYIVNITEKKVPIIIISARGNLEFPKYSEIVKKIFRKPTRTETIYQTIQSVTNGN